MLLDNKATINELIRVAKGSKEKEKGTCIEALEFATRTNPGIASSTLLDFVTETLADEAPRVKWEAAKVIGNIAYLFPTRLDNTISNLLANTEYDGTVVRWASAFALGEILKLKTIHNKDLLPAIETIYNREKDNGVKKKYLDAIKKINK